VYLQEERIKIAEAFLESGLAIAHASKKPWWASQGNSWDYSWEKVSGVFLVVFHHSLSASDYTASVVPTSQTRMRTANTK